MEVDLADPSNEEIWDDSMLINSWNEAIQEYKKYHSIHAKGGSVRDLERESLESSSKNGAQPVSTETQAQQEVEVDDTQELQMDKQEEEEEEPSSTKPTIQTASVDANANAVPPAFPSQAILGSVRDENLKKLLMAWYYAGYYTGLYEGQQQAQQQQP